MLQQNPKIAEKIEIDWTTKTPIIRHKEKITGKMIKNQTIGKKITILVTKERLSTVNEDPEIYIWQPHMKWKKS